MTPWGRVPEVKVTGHRPFAVGSVLWRDARGALMCTVVAKATYDLAAGESPATDVPLPIQEEDAHWDDDPSRSVHLPSDLAPFKNAAEVVIVGSAFAPGERPARSVVARMIVGSVDKAVECWPPRRFRLDGSIDDASPLVRFSLRWEHAAGGPGSDNPAGIDVTRGDVRGRRPIPPLLPPGFELGGPGEHVPIAGLGPIAASWPERLSGQGPHDRAWVQRPAASPLPPTLPARTFQAASPDQWLDRALVANERIVLENLHAKSARIVTSLSGVEPVAITAGGGAVVRLAGDMLFIDTDRALCTLTFRGQVPISENAARLHVVVVGTQMGAPLSQREVGQILERVGASQAEPDQPAPREPADAVVRTTAAPMWAASGPALPFAHMMSSGAPAARPRSADSALPFREAPTDTQPVPPAPTPSEPDGITTAPVLFVPPALGGPGMGGPGMGGPALGGLALGGPAMAAPPMAAPPMAAPPMAAPPMVGAGAQAVPPPMVGAHGVVPPPMAAPPMVGAQGVSPPAIAAPAMVPGAAPPMSAPSSIVAPAIVAPAIVPSSPEPFAASPSLMGSAPPMSVGQQAAAAASAAQAGGSLMSLGGQSLGQPSSGGATPEKDRPAEKSKPAGKGGGFDSAFGGGGKASGGGFDSAFGGGKGAAKPAAAKASSFDGAFGSKGAAKPAPATAGGGLDGASVGLKAASDAAADKERAKEPAPSASAAAAPEIEAPKRLTVVDLLHHEDKVGPRLRTAKRFAPLFLHQGARLRAVQSVDAPRVEAATPERTRNDVLRVLSYGRPTGAEGLGAVLPEGLDEHQEMDLPLVLLGGELRPTFDELDTLRTTIAVAQPVAGGDKKLLTAIALAQEALNAPVPPRADATLGLAKQIEQASLSLSLPAGYVAAEVERILLEARKYKRRPLLGSPRLRADLAIAGGDVLTLYLPDAVAGALPLLMSFPVMAICEPRPREDGGEAREDAMFVMALGRVLKTRAETPGEG